MKLHKLNCPTCNGFLNMEIDKNRKYIFCPFCGQKFIIDDEKRELIINKNINNTKRTIDDAAVIKAKTDAKEKRNSWIFVVILWIILFAIVGGSGLKLYIKEKQAKQEGKIQVGFYRDFKGENFEAIVKQLEVLGFENIATIDLNDAGLFLWKLDKIETISIGGNSNFDSGDYFDTKEKIVITYH